MTAARAKRAARARGRSALLLALTFALAAAGCTPKSALLGQLLPPGTVAVLLGHLETLDDANRRRIAELELRGDFSELAAFAERNLEREPNNAEWWLVAGYAYGRLGRHARAAECFGESVRLAPDALLGWHLLAQAHRGAGAPERAATVLERALLVRRDVPETWFLLGEAYSDLGRFESAAPAYREAVRLDAGFARAWLGLGRAAARLGRAREAEHAARELRRLDNGLAAELEQALRAPAR